MALSDIVPINRREEFLQAIADKSGAPVPVTRIEEFLKRISESSGGSSLPPYTSADKGKVLTVGEAEPQTVIVVPEQSGTISEITYGLESAAYGAILDGVDTSSLANEQSVTFEVAIGPSSNSVTLYYIAETNIFSDALDETGDAYVFLAEVDGQNKWIFNAYGQSTVGLAYTISATTSVPSSVEPKWEKGNIVIPVSEQFTSMFTARLTQEIPKAIQAGVGVPVYAPAATEAATNEAEWDNAVSLIEKSFNEGILPVFYATPVDLIGAKAVLASSANSTWRINGLSTYYSTNGYVFRVDFDYILLLFEQKMVGLSTLVTLLQTP